MDIDDERVFRSSVDDLVFWILCLLLVRVRVRGRVGLGGYYEAIRLVGGEYIGVCDYFTIWIGIKIYNYNII
jgi:hypothetical protein